MVENRQPRKLGKLTPREVVIIEYQRWLQKPGRIDQIVDRAFAVYHWEKRDRALFQELMYGVIRWRERIDKILNDLSPKGVKTDSPAFAAASIGLYQMLYLDRVPDHAVVDTAVEYIWHTSGPQASGWVNAILRRAGIMKDKLREWEPNSRDVIGDLAIKYSHPRWMIVRWSNLMKREQLEGFLKHNNRRPAVILRINSGKVGPGEVIFSLSQEGITATQSEFDPNFLMLENAGDPREIDVVKKGAASVQDISQGLVTRLAGPKEGENVLDLCAAPGGKTGHMAELSPGCNIVATDNSDERLNLVRDLVKRCDLKNVEVKNYTDVIESRELFDIVLLDVPCTGTGVLARRPDLRWRRRKYDITRMAAVQKELLSRAANKVKPGGRLIYSTCSVEPEENFEQISQFLGNRLDFTLKSAKDRLPALLVDEHGCLSIFGPEVNGDGAFAVKMERKL